MLAHRHWAGLCKRRAVLAAAGRQQVPLPASATATRLAARSRVRCRSLSALRLPQCLPFGNLALGPAGNTNSRSSLLPNIFGARGGGSSAQPGQVPGQAADADHGRSGGSDSGILVADAHAASKRVRLWCPLSGLCPLALLVPSLQPCRKSAWQLSDLTSLGPPLVNSWCCREPSG